MDRQSIYDRARSHAKTMRLLATTKEGICRYRVGVKRRCLIGALIRDEDYSEDMEGMPVHERPQILGLLGVSNTDDAEWLMDLQRCHDNASTAAQMRCDLDSFGREHGLLPVEPHP